MGDVKQRGEWDGGYWFLTKSGRKSYVIEREIGGTRFHKSTKRSTETAAYAELRRFEVDPVGYRAAPEKGPEPVRMNVDLVEEFERWQRDDKGVTGRHAYYTAKYLADWLEDFAGADLRDVSLAKHVDPALDRRKGARPKRIAALKVFFAWLRTKKRVLTTAEDCTLDLLVPQAVPEKRRKKKAVEAELVAKVLHALPDRYRDVLLFAASTGWHVTEVQRFARDARSELVELTPEQAARFGCIAVAKTWHKGKVWTTTPIKTAEHLEVAKRIRGRGTFPRTFNKQLKATAIELGGDRKTGAPFYFPLGVMRHSFATWHSRRGEKTEDIAVALNQKDKRTTDNFYIDLAVPRSDLPALAFEKPSLTLH